LGAEVIEVANDTRHQSVTGDAEKVLQMKLEEWVQSWEKPTSSRYAFTWVHGSRGARHRTPLTLGSRILQRLGVPTIMVTQWPLLSELFFVIGGRTAGLRMHYHEPTWVALHAGRKQWYVAKGRDDQCDGVLQGGRFIKMGSNHSSENLASLGFLSCVQEASESRFTNAMVACHI